MTTIAMTPAMRLLPILILLAPVAPVAHAGQVAPVAASGPPDDQALARVIVVDGRERFGAIRQWRLDQSLVLETRVRGHAEDRTQPTVAKTAASGTDGLVQIASEDIDRVETTHAAVPSTGTWRVLTRGGMSIYGEIVGGNDLQVTVRHADSPPIAIPLEMLSGIARRQVPASAALADSTVDRVTLISGDVVDGIVMSIDRAGVVLGDGPDEQRLPWKTISRLAMASATEPEAATATSPGSVAAPVAIPIPASAPGPVRRACIVLVDGTRLIARALAWHGRVFEVMLETNQTLTLDWSRVLRIELLGGRRVWLSEIKPTSFESWSYFGRPWPYRVDRNVANGPLRLNGRTYARGLGLHASARAEWVLAEPFERFTARIGIDDSAGKLADANVAILVNGKETWRSDGIRHGGPPANVDIKLRDARTLTIVVDYGQRGSVQDRVNIVNPALIRPKVK